MTGTVELDAGGTHLVIRFPYREDLVDEVRALPGRRWDKQHKTWRVPASQAELVYATFARHLFEFAPEVSGLLAGTLGQASGDDNAATPAPVASPIEAPAPAEQQTTAEAMTMNGK